VSVTPDRFSDFERVDGLFQRALELPLSERDAFISQTCGADQALRVALEELLAIADSGGTLKPGGALGSPVWEGLAGETGRLAAGDRIGAYRVVEEIGQGGMAVVYRAKRADGAFEGQVALKVLWRGHGRADTERRFLRERSLLARLRHPHIAQLLDAGVSSAGASFLVMELVEGEQIDHACDERRLPIEERLTLFLRICDAVAFAHRNLIVHRDLKPSNILVTVDGLPKLLDFGIAKLLDPDPETGELTQTAAINRMMTPQYASPEQILGEAVSTSADVYGLGLVLYELLSGRRARRLDSSRPKDIERAARDEEAVLPSTVVVQPTADGAVDAAALAAARRSTPERLRSRLRGDLDTIVAMALRREPERRYASVEQLAADVRRHLQGHPVTAHRDSWVYRTRKLLTRRAGPVAAGVLVLSTLVGGIVTTTTQARIAKREARRAEEVVELFTTVLEDADPDRSQGRDVTVREVLDRAARSLEFELGEQPELQASLQTLIGRIYHRLGLSDEAAAQFAGALERRRGLRGADEVAVAETARWLALARLGQGRRDEAETLARESLEIRQRRLRGDAPAVAQGLVTMGQIRYERGAVDEGRRLLDRAFEILEAGGPETEPELSDALHVATLIELMAGELDRAEALGRREVARRRAMGVAISRDLALALYTLASVLENRGREEHVDESVRLLEEALRIERALLGDDHPWTANMLAELAGVRARAGDFAGGEQAFEEALQIAEAALDAEHPFVAQLYNNLAVFYHRQHKWADAIEQYERSLEVRERVLEPNHPLVGTTRAYLGLALHQAGDPRAESAYRAALEELAASLGASHEKVGNLHADLGTLLVERGRYGEAETQLRAAFAITQPLFGDDDQRTDSARSGLGFALCGQGRPDAGEPLLEASRRFREKRYSTGHWRLAELALYESACLLRRGKRADARQRIDEVRALIEPRHRVLDSLAARLQSEASSG